MSDEEDDGLHQYLQANLSAHFAIPEGKKVREASTFGEAVEAGWQMSTGPFPGTLLTRGELPDVTLPENSNRLYRMASQIATLAGDVPAMFAGGAAGAVAGLPEGPAAAATAGAGAFALPAAIRTFLMKGYARGSYRNFSDLWDDGSAALYDGIKQGVVGAASGAAGVGGRLLGGATVVEGKLVGGTIQGATTELATMLAVGNAVEGKFKIPTLDEFTDAAMLMGAAHGIGHALGKFKESAVGSLSGEYAPPNRTARKLMDDYERDGTPPMERAQAVRANPAAHADYLSLEEQAPVTSAGVLPEPPEAAPMPEANVASIHEALGPEGAVPPAPVATVVPGYVSPFLMHPDSVDAFFDRLRQGKEIIRRPHSAEVAYDPRTDVVIDSITKEVKIKPTNIPEGEQPGRTIIAKPDGSWQNRDGGPSIIPARRDTPRQKLADRLDAADKDLASAEAMRDKAVKNAARKKPLTPRGKPGDPKREWTPEMAKEWATTTERYVKEAAERRAQLLAAHPEAKAKPEELAQMSVPELEARAQSAEDRGELAPRLEARQEIQRREEAPAAPPAGPPAPPGTPPPTAAPTPPPGPPSANRIALAEDSVLSHLSFDEPSKETSFLTARDRMYRDYVDKKDPIYKLDMIIQGAKKMARSASELFTRASLDSNAPFATLLEHGVPIYGKDGFASEAFNKVFRDVSSGTLTAKRYAATFASKMALQLSRQVEAARIKNGEAPDMVAGDRFQLFNPDGSKGEEGKVAYVGFSNGTVSVRVKDANGRLVSEVRPYEEVRRNLIALVDGKEVRNVETGIPLEDAQIQVDAHGAEYEAIGKRFRAINDAVIQYAADTNFIRQETANEWKARDTYVPLHRVVETDWSNPLSRLEGSQRQIINPFESYLKDWQYILRKSNENAAKLALHDGIVAHAANAEGLVRIVKPEPKFGIISDADFARISGGHATGLTPNDVTVLTQARDALKPNQLSVNTPDGFRVIEGPKDLIDAYSSLGQQEMSGVMKLLTFPAKLERGGIVNSLSFLVRHGIRNPLMGKLFSENNTGFMDMFGAIGSVWKRDARFQQALADGAMTGTVAKSFNDRGVLQENLAKLAPETGLFNTTWNLVRNGFEAMHTLATVTDNAVKLAEYENALKGGKSRLQAAYEGRNVIPDSQRVGLQMRSLNALIPFLHMHLQGLDKIGQTVAKEGVLATGMRLAPLMYASMGFWLFNHGDSRMDDIPHEQRDLFWIIPTSKWEGIDPNDSDGMANALARPEDQRRISADGSRVEVNNGAIFRIPKPFEAGIVMGSGTERILDLFFKDHPDAFEGFAHSVAGGVLPNYIPTFAKPVIEQFANKSAFTGNPLISAQAEKELPQYRYGDYTTETAKALGKIIAPIPGIGQTNLASPTIIENYIQSYGGYIGSYALELADKGLRAAGLVPDPVKPEDTLADVPFVRAFVIRNPGANTQNLRDFYDAYEKHSQLTASIRAKAAEGDTVELDRLMLLQARDAGAGGLDGMEKSLHSMSHLVRMIYKMPDMSAREKRQQIDGLYYGMNEVAKMGIATMRDVNKELEASDR